MTNGADLRIALIGCGGLGKGHGQELAEMPGIALAAVSDVHQSAAAELAAELASKPNAYSDYKEMFARETLDAVVIVTPNFTHRDITVDAATAGLHVFCEKPMALSVAECDAMIESTERAGVNLMIGYIRRFQPTYMKMKSVLDEGTLGEIRYAFALRFGRGAPGGAGGWQNQRHLYGGMYSQFIHELDQLIWYAGEVSSVEATFRFGKDSNNNVEEVAALDLHFASGASGTLLSSRIHPIGSYEVSVVGTNGSAKISAANGPLLLRAGDDEKTRTIESPQGNGRRAEFEHFFDCIRREKKPGPDGLVGRHGVAVSLAADKAYRSGRRVEVTR